MASTHRNYCYQTPLEAACSTRAMILDSALHELPASCTRSAPAAHARLLVHALVPVVQERPAAVLCMDAGSTADHDSKPRTSIQCRMSSVCDPIGLCKLMTAATTMSSGLHASSAINCHAHPIVIEMRAHNHQSYKRPTTFLSDDA